MVLSALVVDRLACNVNQRGRQLASSNPVDNDFWRTRPAFDLTPAPFDTNMYGVAVVVIATIRCWYLYFQLAASSTGGSLSLPAVPLTAVIAIATAEHLSSLLAGPSCDSSWFAGIWQRCSMLEAWC